MSAVSRNGPRRPPRRSCTSDENPYGRHQAVSLEEVLAGLRPALRLTPEHWLEELRAEWPALVGEQAARHARPGRFESGTLTIFVDNSLWLQELSRAVRGPLPGALRERFDAIRAVRLALDPDGGRPTAGGAPASSR